MKPKSSCARAAASFGALHLGAFLAALCALSCGAQQPEAASPEASEPAAESGAATAAADMPESTPDDGAAAAEASAAEDDATLPAEDPNETRDVVYKMTPGGLEIEVDGIKFMPKAEPVKVKGGAWGLKFTVEAEGVGDMPRYLLKAKNGVLALAGSVKRKGEPEKFGDHRDGDESVEIAPGASVSFQSTWPKDGKPGLWWNDELDLEAGLWGLGKSADALRPVKQFFTLRMVAGNKPQPVIQPPKSAE